MAIDFSQVKTITIPEGSVTKITDSTGNILWQGVQSEGWHTVWEGNQKIGYGGWKGNEYLFATEPYSDTLKIRVSFSELYTWKPSGDAGYSQYDPSNKKSPVTYENFSSNNTTLVMTNIQNNTRDVHYRVLIQYNKANGKIFGRTFEPSSSEYARAFIVITKIEVYS